MSKTAKPALQTKTTPNQLSAFKGHIYTMGAAFAGVIFGVLGSMGFVGSYLNSQFAAQTAALDQRIVAAAPASVASADACYGTSSASAEPSRAVAKAGHVESQAGMVGGRGAEAPVQHPNGGGKASSSTSPFVSQLISGYISNTGQGSNNQINATNNFSYTATNNNNVNVSNNNNQSSSTGSANTSSNTNAGSSSTGASDNTNSTTTVIGIDN